MSNAIDDKELDDYLSGDTQFSQRYHAIAADAIPSELDSLVLGNAKENNVVAIGTTTDKRAGNSNRSKSLGFWMRASVPVALAASFVLVLSIMMESSVRYDSAPTIQSDESKVTNPTPFPKMDVIERPVASLEPPDSTEEARIEAVSKRAHVARADIAESVATRSIAPVIASAPIIAEEAKKESYAPAAPAPLAAAPKQASNAPATELEQIIVTGQYVRGSAEDAALPVDVISSEQLDKASSGSAAGPRSTIPQSSFLKRALSDVEFDKQQRESDPAEWLAYIRDLRTSDKARDADAEWKRFLKAYPNYVVEAADAARPKK